MTNIHTKRASHSSQRVMIEEIEVTPSLMVEEVKTTSRSKTRRLKSRLTNLIVIKQ
jgi:hypothetical protein